MSRAKLMEVERKLLSLLHGHKTREKVSEIHAHFLRHNLHQSNQLLAHFVSVCGHLNKMEYANRIFCSTLCPNILLFNSMIKGYSRNGPCEESLSLFYLMKEDRIRPDEYTFAPLLKACSGIDDVRVGKCVHGEVIRVGFESFSAIRIGIVELYCKFGMMVDAWKVFDEMRERDLIVWHLMIRGFCDIGNVDSGLHLFRQMKERNVVSWNSIISCLAQRRRNSEALALYSEMLEQGIKPDEATVVIMLHVCSRLGAVDVGERIQSYAESSELQHSVVEVGNALVDYHSKCGNLETAIKLFNKMPVRNVVSWNSMILGLALNGKGELGVEYFEEMIGKGENPNSATYLAVLSCCAHAGLVEKGQKLFTYMSENSRSDLKLEHYGSMVDLLARGGHVKMAYDLVRTMPFKPNAALWGALLSSCRTHGDIELAELAAKELINLEPWNSGNYVLLSNIYAEKGRWEEVEKVRVLMNEKSVKKAPGQSTTG